MKGAAITKNFRGLRAIVIQREDTNRANLMRVLARLGLEAELLEPDAREDGALLHCDLVFFDADENIDGSWADRCSPDVSLIALIGNEAPSRLAHVVRQRCDSHILKPIRTNGVYTALLLGVNERIRRRRIDREVETLKQRLAGRRLVMKAILRLMAAERIDEDTAYERLRGEAMKHRIPIEQVAQRNLEADGAGSTPARKAGLSR